MTNADEKIVIALQDAVTGVLGAVARNVLLRADNDEIKRVTTNLREWLALWAGLDKAVRTMCHNLLSHACGQCKHVGAERGSNERDGSWMNACPTCGDTK